MLRKIKSAAELKEVIRMLEEKKAYEMVLFREQVKITYQGLKPINLIKGAMKDLTEIPVLKGGIVNSLMGISAGYISKKIIVGSTYNPLKFLLGKALQMIVTAVVSRNADGIKSAATVAIKKMTGKKGVAV
ncbi:MAG TPA: hypothetical protein VE933_02870 [Chitinophagaceae bacterium]|nr:hypothetical protein [Chitinophagaceae bacterium]